MPRGLAVKHRIADRLVYSKVKARLGGRLRVAISGGAPLAREVAEFFHMLDILILEGYGLTECTTAATVNRPDRYRFGTVGPAMPGVELRLADDGELLISSPTVFAGYLKDEEATRGVLDEDGWLRTGDVATIDDDGFVKITDRKKDILITAGGKNVAPQNLENDAQDVTVHLARDRRRRPQAVHGGADHARRARDRDVGGRAAGWTATRRPFATSDEVRELIQEAIDATNEGRSRFEQCERFSDPPARLHRRRGRDHAHAEDQAQRLRGALRGRIERLYEAE